MRTPSGSWLAATFALAFGCSEPVDPSQTPEPGDVMVAANGVDLARLVRAYPAGTSFYLSSGVYRMSSAVAPKAGSSFIGDAGAIASGRNVAEWFRVAYGGEYR
jgi:hypothetical protein